MELQVCARFEIENQTRPLVSIVTRLRECESQTRGTSFTSRKKFRRGSISRISPIGKIDTITAVGAGVVASRRWSTDLTSSTLTPPNSLCILRLRESRRSYQELSPVEASRKSTAYPVQSAARAFASGSRFRVLINLRNFCTGRAVGIAAQRACKHN